MCRVEGGRGVVRQWGGGRRVVGGVVGRWVLGGGEEVFEQRGADGGEVGGFRFGFGCEVLWSRNRRRRRWGVLGGGGGGCRVLADGVRGTRGCGGGGGGGVLVGGQREQVLKHFGVGERCGLGFEDLREGKEGGRVSVVGGSGSGELEVSDVGGGEVPSLWDWDGVVGRRG